MLSRTISTLPSILFLSALLKIEMFGAIRSSSLHTSINRLRGMKRTLLMLEQSKSEFTRRLRFIFQGPLRFYSFHCQIIRITLVTRQ
ncbi:hypothetical protein F4604DRAFT_1796061 [Suillus subluteus]|nr:hypothetical protein F4604DRAFT_1796061 [Suillus subluteus]